MLNLWKLSYIQWNKFCRDIHNDWYGYPETCGDMSSMGLITNTKAYLAEQTNMTAGDCWYY